MQILGKGATSNVYLLKRNDSKFALKTNPSVREVEFLKRTQHSNIIKLLNNHPQGIILEICAGDLQHVFDSHINIDHLIDLWMFQLLDALSYLSSNNIVHRDVKLANILLNENFDVKLSDFGLAIDSNESVELSGTPNYLSPELLKRHAPSHKSDVYAAGVCCFALLTGQLPFEGGTAKQTLTNIVKQKWNPSLVPLPFKKLVMDMMNVEVKARVDAQECISNGHFWRLHTPLETMFISPFTKQLFDNHIAVLKTGDIILRNPGCVVHVNGSVTMLHENLTLPFFDSSQSEKLFSFTAPALLEIFSEGKTLSSQCLTLEAKQSKRIAVDAASKLYKRYHSVTFEGTTFKELIPDIDIFKNFKRDTSWRAILWKNDDFHFRLYDIIVRFVRSSEIIEVYEPLIEDDSILNVMRDASNFTSKPFIFNRSTQFSVRGIPLEYKLLINIAQAALKKCLQVKVPASPVYQSIRKISSGTEILELPIYHPSSEFVDGIGWLIQIPGDRGQITVELLSLKGERVRIIDDFVLTWNLSCQENSDLPANLESLSALNPQRECYKAYKKNEIPDYVKWFIQKFRK
eukprot:NODE_38_length_35257_cov_0.939047.p4 type:complete len:575 gc:universal NODE_38_length_35257_cov_0.939047:16723-18447(+)